MMLEQLVYQSDLGKIRILADKKGLRGCYLGDYDYLDCHLENHSYVTNTFLNDAKTWLDDYFKGNNPDLNLLTLRPAGTLFQERVWRVLSNIPYGTTTTYGQIAKEIDCKSAQAIGGAIGKNPISIMIPCHRVVGSKGQLTGYTGGLEKKRWLLKHEGVNLSIFTNNK